MIYKGKRYYNKLVDGGKEFMREKLFMNNDWSTEQKFWLRVGDDADTNVGKGIQPTETVGTLSTAAWQGVDTIDFKLTNEVVGTVPEELTVTRTGKEILFEGTLTNENVSTTSL